MHTDRTEETETVPAVPAVDAANQAGESLIDFVKGFTRPMRGRPTQLILDGFDSWFFIRFDFDEDPETPEAKGTCDILIVPLRSDDYLADAIRIVWNANKHKVMRFLAAIGIERFDNKVKTAFYASTNPLRADA